MKNKQEPSIHTLCWECATILTENCPRYSNDPHKLTLPIKYSGIKTISKMQKSTPKKLEEVFIIIECDKFVRLPYRPKASIESLDTSNSNE